MDIGRVVASPVCGRSLLGEAEQAWQIRVSVAAQPERCNARILQSRCSESNHCTKMKVASRIRGSDFRFQRDRPWLDFGLHSCTV